MIRRISIFPILAALAALHPAAAHGQRPTGGDSVRLEAGRAFRREMYDTLAAAGMGTDAHGLLLVDGTRPGPTVRISMLEGDLPDSVLTRLYGAVTARVDAWPRDTIHLTMRLDADRIGDHPEGDEHQPELRNRAEIVTAMSRFANSHSAVGARDFTFRPWLKMLVSRSGQVVFAEIQESSGNADIDAFVIGLGRQMKFTPGRIGHAAVDVWVTLPVTVKLPASAN